MNHTNYRINQLQKGLETAFVDYTTASNLAYKPSFVSNDYKEGRKVLSSIEDELLACEEFSISVAFITMSGITPLLQTLKELEKRGIPGRILTTDYLSFSEPTALDKLAQLKNITLRMFDTETAEEGFHTKGYIFREKEIYRIIVGSSNMTLSALTKNKEWNTRLVSTNQGEYTKEILSEYENLWNSPFSKDYDHFIAYYRTKYELIKEQKRIANQGQTVSFAQYKLEPNKMQVAFVENIKKLRAEEQSRGLLISATGTGKTYASAFAVRDVKPKKMLFLVHREQIAKQAMVSFKRVIGSKKSDGSPLKYGLLSGNHHDYDSDYLFSTMQMMSKPEIIERFDPTEFQFICIDETHRAGSESYQRIIQYFKPEFLLGMTASPERTDNYDIFELYHHNIIYEIRLQQALEENLLCPFHYFGITDLEIDGEVFDDETGVKKFANLVCDARVDYVIEQANYYSHSGDRVKGLIFCSRKDEAEELSRKFNQRGFKAIHLSGADSQEQREDAIDRLVSDTREDYLDYIFTIDIFNEGVDIPEINQVIMLRPTQSPIVFVQQLGRGLRKANEKEYVVILDFIGNYMNNFMIPIALSGDRSYNKDTIRRYVREGARVIPGSSTIHFDEITKTRIYSSIDAANFNDIRLIRECYKQLRYQLGRIPTLMDFETYGSIDPLRIFDNKSLGSYHVFLKKYEKEYKVTFTKEQEKVLEFLSRKFASGKRPHELILLKRMLTFQNGILQGMRQELLVDYHINISQKTETNVVNIMTNNFPTGVAKKTYQECILIESDHVGDYRISHKFKSLLQDSDFHKAVQEIIDFGLYRNRRDYGSPYRDRPFQLYAKYTYEDVCRLLEWEKGEVALNIGGYKYDKKTQTYPVFINYDKEEDISDTTKYEDRLTSPDSLIAISKSGRTVQSEDVMTALKARELGVEMELFVRKNKDDKISKEFYYLGRIYATGEAREFTMPNTKKTAVEISYHLETPVREDLYDYITR